jgi:hypothetical protein
MTPKSQPTPVAVLNVVGLVAALFLLIGAGRPRGAQ